MTLAAWKRAVLRRRYANTPSNQLARELGLRLSMVYYYAGQLGLKKSKAFWHAPRKRRKWTDEQIEILRRDYPNTPTYLLARRLGHGISTVYRYAQLIGVKKSEEFLSGPYSGILRKGKHDGRGAAFRFVKGIVPANKGLRRAGLGPGPYARDAVQEGTAAVGLEANRLPPRERRRIPRPQGARLGTSAASLGRRAPARMEESARPYPARSCHRVQARPIFDEGRRDHPRCARARQQG